MKYLLNYLQNRTLNWRQMEQIIGLCSFTCEVSVDSVGLDQENWRFGKNVTFLYNLSI